MAYKEGREELARERGIFLRDWRKRLELTRVQISECLDISEPQLYNLEKGQVLNPPISYVEVLVKGYRVPLIKALVVLGVPEELLRDELKHWAENEKLSGETGS